MFPFGSDFWILVLSFICSFKMDKSWMNLSRMDSEYDAGVERFLDFAYTNHPDNEKISCPCVNCVNVFWNT